jgi:hypothetical protein
MRSAYALVWLVFAIACVPPQGGGTYTAPPQQTTQAPACPDGQYWDGNQCANPQPEPGVADNTGSSCQGGSVVSADGSQCVCPAGTSWDGQQCVGVGNEVQPTVPQDDDGAPQDDDRGDDGDRDHRHHHHNDGDRDHRDHGPACSALVLQKGYAPDQVPYCDGADGRCAQAVLDKGYAPDQIPNCRGAEPRCAQAVLDKGYAPDQLRNCVNVDFACAKAVLDQGYAPDQLGNCRRR